MRKDISTIGELKYWYKQTKAIYCLCVYSPDASQYLRVYKTDIKEQLFHLHDSTKVNAYFQYNKHSIGGAIFIG